VAFPRITRLWIASPSGFDVAGTNSAFKWRAAEQIKTNPISGQSTALEMDLRTKAHSEFLICGSARPNATGWKWP
jgi:hypothetical protein